MLIRFYQAALAAIVIWFCAAAFLGWKPVNVFAGWGGGGSGRSGAFFGGGWGFGK